MTLTIIATLAAPSDMSDVSDPSDILRAKGWTLRPAAEVLGVHWTHLHKVLTGERHSARLLAKLAYLPAK
jgi:hypothetical protein